MIPPKTLHYYIYIYEDSFLGVCLLVCWLGVRTPLRLCPPPEYRRRSKASKREPGRPPALANSRTGARRRGYRGPASGPASVVTRSGKPSTAWAPSSTSRRNNRRGATSLCDSNVIEQRNSNKSRETHLVCSITLTCYSSQSLCLRQCSSTVLDAEDFFRRCGFRLNRDLLSPGEHACSYVCE